VEPLGTGCARAAWSGPTAAAQRGVAHARSSIFVFEFLVGAEAPTQPRSRSEILLMIANDCVRLAELTPRVRQTPFPLRRLGTSRLCRYESPGERGRAAAAGGGGDRPTPSVPVLNLTRGVS
jgi:hypothetical protein